MLTVKLLTFDLNSHCWQKSWDETSNAVVYLSPSYKTGVCHHITVLLTGYGFMWCNQKVSVEILVTLNIFVVLHQLHWTSALPRNHGQPWHQSRRQGAVCLDTALGPSGSEGVCRGAGCQCWCRWQSCCREHGDAFDVWVTFGLILYNLLITYGSVSSPQT